MSYLANLALRLAAGTEGLSESLRARHAASLAASQRDDGGFAGRKGISDPYYTSFALRGLAMLGELTEEMAHRGGGLPPRPLDAPRCPASTSSRWSPVRY